jgi:hypothetical protein
LGFKERKEYLCLEKSEKIKLDVPFETGIGFGIIN